MPWKLLIIVAKKEYGAIALHTQLTEFQSKIAADVAADVLVANVPSGYEIRVRKLYAE